MNTPAVAGDSCHHGDYFKMLNNLMDNLADIADAIPSAAPFPPSLPSAPPAKQ